jgi:hypothetical protein
MHAIEFETVAQHHTVRLPNQIPDGVRLRVLVLMEDNALEARSASPIADRPLRKPSPKLAGSVVMHDDLLAPAVPEEAWSVLQ